MTSFGTGTTMPRELGRAPTTRRLARALPSLVLALSLVGFAAPLEAQKKPRRAEHVPPVELTNLLLAPDYARWLVGPISWLLEDQGIDAYLALTSDAEAEGFIEEFWQRNAEIRAEFEKRAEEADRRFREGALPGRQTDRGIVWTLYGPPDDTDWADHTDVDEPAVEIWSYDRDRPPGLDGRRPAREYRFARSGDLTIFYRKDPRELRRRRLLDPG
jgi:GWxTD domain-containing protein